MKISDLKGNIKVVSKPFSQEESTNTFKAGGMAGAFQDVAQGFAKGGTSTLLGIGGLGNKIQQGLAGGLRAVGAKVSPSAAGETSIFNPKSETGKKAQEIVTPEGTAQNIGFGAEKIAEYFAPAAKAAQAESFINILSSGIKSPLLAATARIGGKAVVQGVAAGAVQAAQSGGDIKKTLETAATAGVIRGGFATIGEGARAIRLPEKLYSTIFKTTASDMMDELKTESLINIQKTNPARYADLIQRGIVSDVKGVPTLNETVAKQALDMGLKGSIRDMARTVVNGTLDSEAKVQDALIGYKGTVDLGEKQFFNVLKGIAQRYKDVGFNEISNEADRLSAVLKATSGKVDGNTALAIRRLLDRARIASSFDAPASKLSLSQSNLKTLADAARARVNAIPGVRDVMAKYSFYIEALETLAKEAARRGNNQALSLIDSLFLSSAFGGGNMIPGITAGMLRKILTSGHGTTILARLLNTSVASGATSGAIGATSGLTTTAINQQ